MVSDNDSTGLDKPIIYNHLPKLLRGFYEGYSLGKNTLGEHFPSRPRKADSYGGDSIWGQKDAIISKYHWDWDKLMWGVSWANVMLMIADGQRTDYESRHEDKGGNNDVIDLSDLSNIDKLKRMAQ